MIIEDVMSRNVVTIRTDATVAEAAQLLSASAFSGMPVVDENGQVIGVVTEGDMIPKLKGVPFSTLKIYSMFGDWFGDHEFEDAFSQAKDKRVSEIIAPHVYTVEASDNIVQAAKQFSEHGIKRLPVLRDGKLVGIVTRSDIVRALASRSD